MTRYVFEKVKGYGRKSGPCEVCGKHVTRSKVFENTVNPWNTNDDGTPRTWREIGQHVNALAREWESGPVMHARCEATP